MGCLAELVGITQGVCACQDDVGSLATTTGLYIDDIEHGITISPISSNLDCGEGSAYDLLSRGRDEAERDFITDMTVMIGQFNRVRVKRGTDTIGKVKTTNYSPVNNDYHGLVFCARDAVGGAMTIHSLKVSMTDPNAPGSNKTMTIYDKDTQEVVRAITYVEGVEQTFTDLVLTSDRSYLFVLDTSDHDKTLLNNKIKCGCGGETKYYANYFNVSGFYTDDLTDLFQSNCEDITANAMAYGITIKATSDCSDLAYSLCTVADNYNTSGFARTVAKAYQLYVIRKSISIVLNSNNINRYTLLDKEKLMGRQNKVAKAITDYMTWIAQNIDPSFNNCYICNTGARMYRQSINI